MGVKFFGQFLIERGEIDAAQLREALDLLEETNRNLGEVAIANRMMTEADAARVNFTQRTVDRPFGDLAVELGLLDKQQLVECLRIREESRLMIGEGLVRLGHMAEDRVRSLLDEFKLDQEPFEIARDSQLPDPLANNRVALYVLDLLPKFAMRVAHMTLKVGKAQVLCEAPALPYRVAVPVHGHRNLEITLVGDRAFCRALSAGAAGVPRADVADDMLVDGVGEFLNVLAGNAICALERDGGSARLAPPDYDAELSDGWIFDLAASEGRAALILSQF